MDGLPKDEDLPELGHGYENPLPHGQRNVKTPSPLSARFQVQQVKNEPKDKIDLSDSDSGAHSRICSDSSRPISIADGTIGYATNEAVPMTVFYRNEHSQSHAKKSRPTLQELQKGFEEVSDQQPDSSQAANVEEENNQTFNDIKVYTHGEKVKLAPKFGWIKGVMLRCLLNIWGVMLFLRVTWVVGQSGIGWSTVIILLSAIVTVLTTLSMSAVCTNGEVKGGGAYFLISRSLGPEFGGSIGLIFSLANAVAVALYVVGFAETVRDILRDNDALMVDEINDIRIVGVITVLALLFLTLIGLEWVVRTQMFLLAILLISILDAMIGTFIGPQNDLSKAKGFMGYKMSIFETNLGPEYRDGENFFSVFAVFFPAATGILAGVNISGDLKDAQKAIPQGTLLAILISTIVYVVLAWFAGACVLRDAHGVVATAVATVNASGVGNVSQALPSCPGPKCVYGLMNDNQVMEKISAWGPLVTGGIFAATLSSALASLVGAPKTFQALCKDNVFPYINYFGVGMGPGDEPRRGYLLTFVIAGAFIAIGELNVIAPVISNFFLMSYALINYAVFAASLARSPGWRPSFKYYNMWVSLVGALVCVAIMFLINWWAALVTIVIVTALYKYVDIKKPNVNWGSSAQAYTYIRALRFSYRLNTVEDHVKNFRPQCLVLTGPPSLRPNLTYIVSQITRNVGLMVCGQVNVGPFARVSGYEHGWLKERKIRAFHTICTAPTLRSGVQGMLQSTGVGKLRPNTLVLGFKRNWKKAADSEIVEYVNIINDAFEMNYGVAILRIRDEHQIGTDEYDGDGDDWMGDGEEENFVPKTHSPSASKASFSERQASQGSGLFSDRSPNSGGRFFHVERAMTPESVGLLDEPSDIDTIDKLDERSKGLNEGRKKFVLTENIDLNDSEHSHKETSSFIGSAAPGSELDYPEGSTRVEVGSLATGGGMSVKTSDLSVSETLTVDSEKNKDRVSEKSGLTETSRELASKPKRVKDEELVSSPISFRGKQKGTIDVWWLADDGGLTILIPYILSLNNVWKDCKLRIVVPASTRNIKNNEVRMANLLKKFRIDFSSIEEVQGTDKPPSRKCIEEFLKLPIQGEFEEGIQLDKRMLRQIRTGELLREHSKDARLIVITLPVPKLGMMSATLYMSWLEVLSAELPPVLMVRGNQTSVLTFYC